MSARKRVTAAVGFMSPDECARRVRAASQGSAVVMLKALEANARDARDQEWRDALMLWSGGSGLSMEDEYSGPLRKLWGDFPAPHAAQEEVMAEFNNAAKEGEPMQTRAEHMRWCKERAHRAYDYYLAHGSEEEARRNAIASIVSDLSKHPETANMQQMAVMLCMTVTDKASLDRFIDGFAE